jgi:hypothetical protein
MATGALIHMATLLEHHPLYNIVQKKTTKMIKKHKAPINSLLTAYKCEPAKIEKIPVVERDPAMKGKLPFTTYIAGNREESTWEAETATEEIQVYLGGLAINRKVGAAAVLIQADSPPHIRHDAGTGQPAVFWVRVVTGAGTGLGCYTHMKLYPYPQVTGFTHDRFLSYLAFKTTIKSLKSIKK